MQIIEKNIDDLIPYENNPRNNDEAKKMLAPLIKKFNERSKELAKKYNQRPKLITVQGYLR